MKYITKLKDLHKGQIITVIGAGESMDHINPQTFKLLNPKGKIIGINWVFKRFKVDYTVSRHIVVIKESPENLVYPEITCDLDGLDAPKVPGWRFRNELVQSGTTAKTAIDLARYMGAREIIVAGCECYGGYYKGYPTGATNRAWLNQVRYDMELFIDYIRRRYGVSVLWLNDISPKIS